MTDEDAAAAGERGPDLGPATTLFAALAVLLVAAGSGSVAPAAFVVAAALLAVGGCSMLAPASTRRLAAAGGAVVFGLAALGTAVPFVGPIAALGAVAVGATGVALAAPTDLVAPLARTLRESTIAAVGVGLACLSIVGVPLAESVVAAGRALDLATATPSVSLLSIGGLVALALFVWEFAAPKVTWLVPAERHPPTISDLAVRLLGLPSGAWIAIWVAVVIALLVDVAGAFEDALRALGPVGTAVEWLLQSGLIHAGLGLAAVAGALAFAAWLLAIVGRLWLGSYPIRTLALGSGGLVAASIVAAVAAAGPPSTVPREYVVLAFYATLVVAFVLAFAASRWAGGLTSWRIDGRRVALAVGAGALFLATVLGALEGLAPAAVFAGVAASVLVWDLGENALTARRHLGPGVDTRSTELVHAFGSVLAGGLGVAVATAAAHLLVRLRPPGERWQALAALVVALAATALFALAAVRGLPTLPDRRRLRGWAGLPRRYPRSTSAVAGVLVLSWLAARGYDQVVFFVVVVVAPIVLLALADTGSGPRREYDRW